MEIVEVAAVAVEVAVVEEDSVVEVEADASTIMKDVVDLAVETADTVNERKVKSLEEVSTKTDTIHAIVVHRKKAS